MTCVCAVHWALRSCRDPSPVLWVLFKADSPKGLCVCMSEIVTSGWPETGQWVLPTGLLADHFLAKTVPITAYSRLNSIANSRPLGCCTSTSTATQASSRSEVHLSILVELACVMAPFTTPPPAKLRCNPSTQRLERPSAVPILLNTALQIQHNFLQPPNVYTSSVTRKPIDVVGGCAELTGMCAWSRCCVLPR